LVSFGLRALPSLEGGGKLLGDVWSATSVTNLTCLEVQNHHHDSPKTDVIDPTHKDTHEEREARHFMVDGTLRMLSMQYSVLPAGYP